MTAEIRRLVTTDAAAYRAIMLEGYAAHPEAFTSSAAERAALPLSWWLKRLGEEPSAEAQVFGAIDAGGIAGVAGLRFETQEKIRHKATLFGMYVPAPRRGQGIGRRLVMHLLDRAAECPGLRLVQLTVTEGNHAAESLYRGCGFVRFGVEPLAMAVDDAFVAKVYMWRELGANYPPVAGAE